MKLLSIKKIESEPVYDIQVEHAHHYILDNGVITHNSGLDYAASGIVFFTKKKDKDNDNQVTGVILKATLKKSRLTIENKVVETRLNYQTGLDPYYGLIDLCLKFGIFKKMATKIVLPDGTTEFASKIEDNPEKYFTKELLDSIDEKCKAEFLYGTTSFVPLDVAEAQ